MHRHDSFLEMKVIIQLSGLISGLEDTDGGQKPVQMPIRPRYATGDICSFQGEVHAEESVGPRTLRVGFTPVRLAVRRARGMGIRPCSGVLLRTH